MNEPLSDGTDTIETDDRGRLEVEAEPHEGEEEKGNGGSTNSDGVDNAQKASPLPPKKSLRSTATNAADSAASVHSEAESTNAGIEAADDDHTIENELQAAVLLDQSPEDISLLQAKAAIIASRPAVAAAVASPGSSSISVSSRSNPNSSSSSAVTQKQRALLGQSSNSTSPLLPGVERVAGRLGSNEAETTQNRGPQRHLEQHVQPSSLPIQNNPEETSIAAVLVVPNNGRHSNNATASSTSATLSPEERAALYLRQAILNATVPESVEGQPIVDTPPGPQRDTSLPLSNTSSGRTNRFIAFVALAFALITAVVIGIVRFSTSRNERQAVPPSSSSSSDSSMNWTPTASPSTSSDGTMAFISTDELRQAVDAYLAEQLKGDATSTSDVAVRYGYPIGTWDVSRLTDLSRVFDAQRYQNFDGSTNQYVALLDDELDVGAWDVSNVSTMYRIFAHATAYTGRGLEQWNVRKVTNFSYAFTETSLFNGNISNWDLQSATTLDFMFYNAQSFAQDVSLWNVTSVQSMISTFDGASNFTGGDLEQWNVGQVRNMHSTFANCPQFRGYVSTWDTGRVERMDFMFYRASVFDGNLAIWNVQNVQSMSHMFAYASSFTGGDLTLWTTSQVRDLTAAFAATALRGDVSTWDVSNNIRFRRMFDSCTEFVGDLSQWNVSSAVDMSYMLYGASSFNRNLSSWNVSRVSVCDEMFRGASRFNQSLCAWGEQLRNDRTGVSNMFEGTGCLNTSTPSLAVSPAGPFCAPC